MFEDRVWAAWLELARLDVVVDFSAVVDFDFVLVVSDETVWVEFVVNDDISEC